MIELGTSTFKIMDMETGEDLGVINELPEIPKLATGGMIFNVNEPILANLGETCECSFNVIIKPDTIERLKRLSLRGTNNRRKRHHIPMMRKIYRR